MFKNLIDAIDTFVDRPTFCHFEFEPQADLRMSEAVAIIHLVMGMAADDRVMEWHDIPRHLQRHFSVFQI